MTSNPQEDANQAAARVVAQSTATDKKLPAELEAAWEQWSSQIQQVDRRGMELLRAAFEAGYQSASRLES